jgi:NADH pyrophosphatase NudC (nudix superfamily)
MNECKHLWVEDHYGQNLERLYNYHPFCPKCGEKLSVLTYDNIADNSIETIETK